MRISGGVGRGEEIGDNVVEDKKGSGGDTKLSLKPASTIRSSLHKNTNTQTHKNTSTQSKPRIGGVVYLKNFRNHSGNEQSARQCRSM